MAMTLTAATGNRIASGILDIAIKAKAANPATLLELGISHVGKALKGYYDVCSKPLAPFLQQAGKITNMDGFIPAGIGSLLHTGLTGYLGLSAIDTGRLYIQKHTLKGYHLVSDHDIGTLSKITTASSIIGAVPILGAVAELGGESLQRVSANPTGAAAMVGNSISLAGKGLNFVHKGIFKIPSLLLGSSVGGFLGSYRLLTQVGFASYMVLHELYVKMVEDASSFANAAIGEKYLFRINDRGPLFNMNVWKIRGEKMMREELAHRKEVETSKVPGLSSGIVGAVQGAILSIKDSE